MTVQPLSQPFTVCKVGLETVIDWQIPFTFMGVTDTECSLVCPTQNTPAVTLAREDGWRAFRVTGSMAFTLVGVLAKLTGTLAERGIPVFAVSTFDTDYVLVKAEQFDLALDTLAEAGIEVERG